MAPGGAGSSRAARQLLLVYLACGVISRLADANPHPNLWYTPCVLACFVLPIWYSLGKWPEMWERMPVALLAVQAAVTYVPLFVFREHWVGGVDGLLAGLALTLLPRKIGWWAFGGLAALELIAWNFVGPPYQPAYHSTIWLFVAYSNVALGYFGLNNAVRVLERLEATAEMLADAAVDRQRLSTAAGLQATILRRLAEVQQHAAVALASPSTTETEAELRLVGDAARDAAASARRIVSDIPQPSTPRADDTFANPLLAQRIVLAVALLFALQFVMNTAFAGPGGSMVALSTVVIALSVALVMVYIQLRHSPRQPVGRPRGWGWTLGAQAVLCFALYPVAGVASLLFVGFVCGSLLLLVNHPVRWALAGLFVSSLVLLTVFGPTSLRVTGNAIMWSIYASAIAAAASLVFYGFGRFVRASAALAESRARLAETAVTRERVRLARDTHDTLGLALSAIALKSDLATALLARDPPRARREIVQAIHLSRSVAADADSIVHGNLRLHLDTEVESARSALEAAGVSVTVDCAGLPLSNDVETEAASILREAVANVLRHSDARMCSITITGADGFLELQVVNDGAREPASEAPAGSGLANIQDRAAAVGGSAGVTTEAGTFTLTARLPVGAVDALEVVS
jgi:two-component system sensor histidine kinase DesK